MSTNDNVIISRSSQGKLTSKHPVAKFVDLETFDYLVKWYLSNTDKSTSYKIELIGTKLDPANVIKMSSRGLAKKISAPADYFLTFAEIKKDIQLAERQYTRVTRGGDVWKDGRKMSVIVKTK